MAIWQDLVDDHRFAALSARVGRFVLTSGAASLPEARVLICTACPAS